MAQRVARLALAAVCASDEGRGERLIGDLLTTEEKTAW